MIEIDTLLEFALSYYRVPTAINFMSSSERLKDCLCPGFHLMGYIQYRVLLLYVELSLWLQPEQKIHNLNTEDLNTLENILLEQINISRRRGSQGQSSLR